MRLSDALVQVELLGHWIASTALSDVLQAIQLQRAKILVLGGDDCA